MWRLAKGKIVAHNCIFTIFILFNRNHSDETSEQYPNVEVLSSPFGSLFCASVTSVSLFFCSLSLCVSLSFSSVSFIQIVRFVDSNIFLLKWQLKQQNRLRREKEKTFSLQMRLATKTKYWMTLFMPQVPLCSSSFCAQFEWINRIISTLLSRFSRQPATKQRIQMNEWIEKKV